MGYHYVPQAYLRGFCAEGSESQVVVYDKEEKRFFQTHVKNVGQERDFYDEDTEKVLGREVEDPAKPAIDRLRDGEAIVPEDREHMALYAAVMLTRVPESRRRSEGHLPETVRETVGQVRSQLEDLTAREDTDHAVLAKKLQEIEGLEEKLIENPPAAVVNQIRSPWPSKAVVSAIHSMRWQILR
ncbi:MAG: DUF4238 domain-containing protein, partial [Acidobacteria bacterium]|nr:DUF4238 domain-containing protein [Acidobacteriota bacterium]